ncbi:hypothetical protein LUZ61_020118 [Rhynchospora tenuis]|uniref:Uncharacterized protein n=1 Tax=Rhynchospora tenuis TaxID=198213 RepID=A0AAD5ZCG9_9POAL|nr:hypothetical protein LUZ61_020118 [Rhynchospora tenuis]
MKMEYLDFVLVPLGLAALLIYHLWLLHKILHHPDTTVIGNNARNYVVWVETIMQSVRYYSNAGCLLAIPPSKSHRQPGSSYATGCVIKGSYFSALGFHSLYFSIPLFVWIFGPIPMSMCSLLLIFLLYFLDTFRGNDGNKEAIHGSVKRVGLSSHLDQPV